MTLKGRLQGYGHCYRCKETWDEAPHNIMIPCADNKDMFPVCDDCYKVMSFKEIRYAIEDLARIWAQQGPLRLEEHRADMHEAIGWVRRDKLGRWDR